MIGRKSPEGMTGLALNPDDDAGVLKRVVGEQQAGSDRADLGALRVLEHRLQPSGVDRFGVVVQKEQMLAARRCGRRRCSSARS